ncbi:MAG: hypothetical protein QOG58_2546 [Caballeronia sp.]|nr:hypothetical protein [Caballeronia sp.]
MNDWRCPPPAHRFGLISPLKFPMRLPPALVARTVLQYNRRFDKYALEREFKRQDASTIHISNAN